MRIINILATESVENAFVRQPIEFYLAHKILEHPLIYWKAKVGNSYKIVDCSACELKMGISIDKVLQAARIVSASEIILPDKVKSNESLDISLKALSKLNNKQLNEFKIAIVIQGETLNDALYNLNRLCGDHDAMVLIDTIMIPKWFTTPARFILTKEAKRLAPSKNIHWLGLGDDIGDCIRRARELDIRSMDTGYFLSIAQKRTLDVIKSNRDKQHSIDLEHNKLNKCQIASVIDITNTHNYYNDRPCKAVEDAIDREFADKTLKLYCVILIVILLCICYFICVH